MAVCTISRLLAFGCSKTLPERKLVGTFEVVKSEDSEFPISTIIFNDTTGKLACHFDNFQPCWLSKRIAVTKWNFILNRLPNGRISSMYLEVMEVEMDDESFMNVKTGSDQALLERFLPRSPATISRQHEDTHLIGKVHIKSILHQEEDNSVNFLLTLVSNLDEDSHVHVLFSKNDSVEHYVSIIVGKTYLLANLKMHKRTSSMDFVYEFSPTSSAIFHIEDKHAVDYLESSNLSAPHDSRLDKVECVLENPIDMDHDHTPFFTYKGTITCIIDNVLGVFVLDSRYILHLSQYPSYNYLSLPYRMGVTLLLYNIHAVPMKLDRDIWKLSLRKNCPRFDEIKIIFVACFCSTIQISKFPSINFYCDVITPRVVSKFSLFLDNELFNLTDLLWVQKVYYEISEKFPNKFDDITLLGNPLDRIKISLLSKLFQRYRIYDRCRRWPEDFFSHRFSCNVCRPSNVCPIKFISLAELLRVIERIELPPNIFDGIENCYAFRVVSQSEIRLDSVHLMGILEGNINGELQLKDHTGQILAINISSIQRIQTYHLDSVWVIPEYEIVVERPGKAYIRFAIDKCFCFFAKPSAFPSDLSRCLFRVLHIHPTKVDYASEGKPPKVGFKMHLDVYPIETDSHANRDMQACASIVQLKSHLEELSITNESSKEVTYFHLSGDFLRFLPAIHIGSTYELACISALEKSDKNEFSMKNINAAKIRSIQMGPESTIYKDLLDREFGSALDGAAKNIHQVSSIISMRGLLLSKEFRATATLPKFIGQPFRKGVSSQRDTSLLLRVRDLHTKDVVDVYLISTTRYIVPLGIVPGQPLVLRQIIAKTSELGNVYCCSLPTTHISLAGFPKDGHTVLQELESTKLVDLHDISVRAISRVHCTITRIIHLTVQLICEICEQVYYENTCPNGCTLFPPKFRAEGRFEIKDGTSKAIVLAKDEHLLRGFLKLNDQRYQKIYKDATRKKIYYPDKNDKNNLLNQVCTGSIGREIILYCRPISQHLKKSDFPDQMELSVAGVEEVRPELEAFKYLQSLKKFYNA
ncbi:15734_t:CDS:2 [Acaulospora morrowiae]|uniref:CST complex subunit CTC1 n=1 Tax=Acaulospora morrowiae TaxID=94023 RepID=A0A9N8VRT2_9GLOM|nr:15734_t:CDS:2 [Acaulospora morrowiae]